MAGNFKLAVQQAPDPVRLKLNYFVYNNLFYSFESTMLLL